MDTKAVCFGRHTSTLSATQVQPPLPFARALGDDGRSLTVQSFGMRLSIVIPTLNAAASLPSTLDAVFTELTAVPSADPREIVISDGGSTDGTLDVADRAGLKMVAAPPGRGAQLAAGVAAAAGDWLMILHADSRPEPGWLDILQAFAADPNNAERAACFRLRLDDDHRAARRIERAVAWRSRVLALPYGDQGLILSRSFYDALGGYTDVPLMEDVSIIRRIGRRRLVVLDLAVVTSAARYRRDGWIARPTRNLMCLTMYFLGIPPRHILRVYR